MKNEITYFINKLNTDKTLLIDIALQNSFQ